MDKAIQPIESAAMPLLPELTRRMIIGLDQNKSFGDLYKIFREMVTLKLQSADGQLRNALLKLQENDKECLCIFHAISRRILRSLLMGRLAMDLWQSESGAHNRVNNWHHTYAPTGPGTYALAVYVRGRQGKWLSINEIRDLVKVLREYDSACKLYDTHSHGDASYTDKRLNHEQRSFMTRAMSIDNHFSSTEFELAGPGSASQASSIPTGRGTGLYLEDYEMPRFAPTDDNSINDLCNMLRRRCGDFDPNVWQESGPVQIGCTGDLHKRLPAHNPRTSSLVGSSKNLGLLASAMAELGYDPAVVAVPILRVWEYEQLALSEIMVHVLAGSFIDERGLNKHHPGVPTRADEKKKALTYEDCKVHVWVENPWWTENIEYTRQKMIEANEAALQEKARELKLDELMARANKLLAFDFQEILDEHEKAWKELEECFQKILDDVAVIREQVEETDRLVEKMDAFMSSIKEMMEVKLFGSDKN